MCKHCELGEPILKGNFWEVKIENEYDERELYVEVIIGSGYESVDEHVYVDIKFCPVCGKKLEKKREGGVSDGE